MASLDVRASEGALMLAWLPVNSALALIWAPADATPQVLRIYRTKDDAYAHWHQMHPASPRLPGETPAAAMRHKRPPTGAQLPTFTGAPTYDA